MFYIVFMKMSDTAVLVCSFIFLFILVVIAVYYFFNVLRLLFSTTKKAPYIPSFDRQLELMKQLKLKKNSTIVDLWCGDWKVLRFFSQEHGVKSADWFDINYYAIFKWKILNKRHNITNVNLYRKDLFKVDLKKYDYIYVYLWATQLVIMEDWLWKDKNKDTVIISNSFQFKKHKPFKVYKNDKWVDTIFLYK